VIKLNVKIPGPKDFIKYVWGLRLYLVVIIAIFVAFYILGYFAAMMMPSTGTYVVSDFKQEVTPLKSMSPLGLMLGIFLNNALKCLLVIVLGLALGIAPALFMLANGLILGIVIGVTIRGTSLSYVLVGTIPHGVIEIPMVLISSAIGLKLGMDLMLKLFRKKASIGKEIREGLTMYFVYIMPLLLLAAIIETFVTGPLLFLLFGAHG
jgi:stage II sporulation protein M